MKTSKGSIFRINTNPITAQRKKRLNTIYRVKTITLLLFISLSFSLSAPVLSKPINETLGDTWKAQCKKKGGSIYACCKNKEKSCRGTSPSDRTSKDCGQRYKACTSKKFKRSQMRLNNNMNQKNHRSLPTTTIKKRLSQTRVGEAQRLKNPRGAVVGIVPKRGSSRNSYCKLSPNGSELIVRFANSGDLSSTPIGVSVTFGSRLVHKQIPVIPKGQSRNIKFTIPRGCFNSDCRFKIKWSNQPPVHGVCIG